jgi:hypothetical protein
MEFIYSFVFRRFIVYFSPSIIRMNFDRSEAAIAGSNPALGMDV